MDQLARIDLHCHSSASYDGGVDPVRLLVLCRERGLTHVAITDHETLDGALAAQAANVEGITLIIGEEVRTADGDLILLFVNEPVPGGLSLEETVRRARQQGCLIGLPHAFDAYRPSVGVGAVRQNELQGLAAIADYVEVHNGRVRDEHANARASDLARQFGLPQVAATDCHTEPEIGTCYAELPGAPRSVGELRAALVSATMRVVGPAEPEAPESRLGRLRNRLGRSTGWRG